MKSIVPALVCAAAACVAKLLPTSNFGISWRVDQSTHRGTSLNNVAFWCLLALAAGLLIVGVIQRARAAGN